MDGLFIVLVVTTLFLIGVGLYLFITGGRKKKAGLMLFLFFAVCTLILAGCYLYIRTAGVRKDMIAINRQLGITERVPLFSSKPFFYYKEYFEQKLKAGMSRDEVESIVKGASTVWDSEVDSTPTPHKNVLIYRYEIGKYGLACGHNLSVFIRFDENDRVKDIGFDNS